MFLFHTFTLLYAPLPRLVILCLKRGSWSGVYSVIATENVGFWIKLGSTQLLFTQCRSFLTLRLVTTSVTSTTVLPGWLLPGISELAMGAHPLPRLKLLTSHNSSGHKLEQGFYFPSYQEEPQCGCFYDAPGLFSHFGSFFLLAVSVSQNILQWLPFSPPQIFLHPCTNCCECSLPLYETHHSLHTRFCLSIKMKRGKLAFPLLWASTSAVWALLVLAAAHESKSAREDVIHPLPQEALQDVFVLNAWWFFTCLVNLPQLGCLFHGDRRGKTPWLGITPTNMLLWNEFLNPGNTIEGLM